MVRLTRAQQQQRTRTSVLAAARQEFAAHGFADVKVDRIAERAELTRGAVYSNFPSKRALYLAVLLNTVERAGGEVPASSPPDAAAALGALARVWLERIPLIGDSRADGRLQLRSLTGVLDDEPARTAMSALARLEALLLALALESQASPRRVLLAEQVLTLLDGASHLAETSPGFGDPFALARACEHLGGIALDDAWAPPYAPYVPAAAPCDEPWSPPDGLTDLVTGRPAGLGHDGVLALLGTGRVGAAEQAVRGARPGDRVTVVVLTDDPAGLGRLARLRIGDLVGCLRRVFAPGEWPRLQLVVDDDALVAEAAGITGTGDDTEAAIRIRDGRIVARAEQRGAAHAAAVAGADTDA